MNPNQFLQNNPQAIFFDFDGVILESSSIKTLAFVELFNHLNPAQQKAVHEYHIAHMGISRYKKFEWIYKTLLGKEITETESKALGQGFTDIVYNKILKAPFVPGIEQFLAWAQEHTLNFVASGTPQEELRKVVEARKLQANFKEVLGSPTAKSSIVNGMIEKYQLDRKRCWFVGDANTDYNAAMDTQLNFIARNTAEFSDFWSNKAHIICVDDFSDLLN
jgi:phosphoglycolate phosphatase-like HAD superfamily hydrolase